MSQIAELLTRQLKSATLELQSHAAANRMLLAAKQLSDALLEFHYRPDQPAHRKARPKVGNGLMICLGFGLQRQMLLALQVQFLAFPNTVLIE